MTVTRFKPEPAGTTMSVAEFAALPGVEVSARMVRKWVAMGLPARRRGSAYEVDAAKGRAWLKANRTEWSGRGGQANSPPKGQRRATPPDRVAAPPGRAYEPARDAGRGSVDQEALDRLQRTEEQLAELDGREPEDIVYTVTGLLALDPMRCKQLEIIENVLAKRLERLKLEGTLVEAEGIRKHLVRMFDAARRELQSIPTQVVARVRTEAGLDGSGERVLRQVLEQQLRAFVDRLCEAGPERHDASTTPTPPAESE
jgi:hypothetical protein